LNLQKYLVIVVGMTALTLLGMHQGQEGQGRTPTVADHTALIGTAIDRSALTKSQPDSKTRTALSSPQDCDQTTSPKTAGQSEPDNCEAKPAEAITARNDADGYAG
jgi:cytoskeletal protein RodZ